MISPNPYSVRSSRRKSRLGGWLIALACVVMVVLILYWRAPLSSFVLRLVSPAFVVRNSLHTSEVAALQTALASTTAALADRNALYQENQSLKQLLNRSDARSEVLAGVIMRPPATPYDTLLIDAGKNQGVAVGALVYGGGTLVIGQVSEVFDTEARVTLLSAPGRDYDAEIAPTATPGSIIALPLVGQGGGSLMGQVPAGSTVKVGDSILVPGVEGSYVGSISHIDQESGASFESIYAQLPVDPFALRYVEVLKQ